VKLTAGDEEDGDDVQEEPSKKKRKTSRTRRLIDDAPRARFYADEDEESFESDGPGQEDSEEDVDYVPATQDADAD
jgi:hypothetical protein